MIHSYLFNLFQVNLQPFIQIGLANQIFWNYLNITTIIVIEFINKFSNLIRKKTKCTYMTTPIVKTHKIQNF